MIEIKTKGLIKVGNYEFTSIEGGFGKDKKSMLVKDIANIHSRKIYHINELIIEIGLKIMLILLIY